MLLAVAILEMLKHLCKLLGKVVTVFVDVVEISIDQALNKIVIMAIAAGALLSTRVINKFK